MDLSKYPNMIYLVYTKDEKLFQATTDQHFAAKLTGELKGFFLRLDPKDIQIPKRGPRFVQVLIGMDWR